MPAELPAPPTPTPNRQGPRPLGLYTSLLQALTFKEPKKEEAEQDLLTFLEGVKKYRAFPSNTHKGESYTVIAQRGRVTLRDYGRTTHPTAQSTEEAGPPTDQAVFLIPSFINKSYIFDLLPETSLIKHLKDQGVHVFMIDWGTPPADHTQTPPLTLESAIGDHLVPFIQAACHHINKPSIPVLGYCMGGLLALGAAALAPQQVKALFLAATPWDFSQTATHHTVNGSKAFYDLLLGSMPCIPLDILQTQLALLDPAATIRRLQTFATQKDSATLKRMTAIEDWLADGICLETPIARTILLNWYADNETMQGTWHIAGTAVRPETLPQAVWLAVPEKDVIVPPASTQALAEKLKVRSPNKAGEQPQTVVKTFQTGHIGLMAGRQTKEAFLPLVDDFIRQTS